MSIELRFEIEKYGLVHTILNTSPGHYMTGYCNMLKSLTLDNDEITIKILLPKLLAWYDEGNYDELMKSKYCYNKDIHIRTYTLLKDFVLELGIKYNPPQKKNMEGYDYNQSTLEIDPFKFV